MSGRANPAAYPENGPGRLFLERAKYAPRYQPPAETDDAEALNNLVNEWLAEIKIQHPELDENNQRQATS